MCLTIFRPNNSLRPIDTSVEMKEAKGLPSTADLTTRMQMMARL